MILEMIESVCAALGPGVGGAWWGGTERGPVERIWEEEGVKRAVRPE